MSRYERRTAPLNSKLGIIDTYEEQERHLVDAEVRGRDWALEQARGRRLLTDYAILELHRAMFEPLFDWAGETRREDVGPGGIVHVPFRRVREELRKMTDDFGARLSALGDDPSVEQIANEIADVHHRFQWIHPFLDTNGRTGRVLDHFVLWSCFQLVGSSVELSKMIVYFPDDQAMDDYYDGLLEADLHRPERLRNYYLERLSAAFRSPA